MKQVIRVFGESATGKKTFINYLLKQEDKTLLENLGLENKHLDVSNITILPSKEYAKEILSYQKRCERIFKDIVNFLENPGTDVLLIKGQHSDIDEEQANTLNLFMQKFPDLERIIYLLKVSNLDLLYQRITHKDWWKEAPQKYAERFPREWLDKSVENHEQMVLSYQKFGFQVTHIDTTHGYQIMKEERKWAK